jgi:hypothetical protein
MFRRFGLAEWLTVFLAAFFQGVALAADTQVVKYVAACVCASVAGYAAVRMVRLWNGEAQVVVRTELAKSKIVLTFSDNHRQSFHKDRNSLQGRYETRRIVIANRSDRDWTTRVTESHCSGQ